MRVEPNENAGSKPAKTDRAEKITAGDKVCVILGYFFEKSYGNKKLQVGYAVIDDGGNDPSENGIIHIDSLLIRDTVAWKHQNWAAGCGYSEPYDNEDHTDINKIIMGCLAVKCDFKERSYTDRNGNEKHVIEIGGWQTISEADANVVLSKNGIDKLILSCEQSFEKIIAYRENRGDEIERATLSKVAGSSDPNADFDNFVESDGDTIPF